MKIYVINGPNINMLGVREPDIYGSESYKALTAMVKQHAKSRGVKPVFRISNHEGELVDYIQEAFLKGADGIVINPAAYTHTSIAILDAIKSTALPTVEVHISKVDEREDFRKVSYVREVAIATVSGKGLIGYNEAIDLLIDYVKGQL